MIVRDLQTKILGISSKMPVLIITGPRQSGKTTLCKMTFPEYDYVNLELPENRIFVESDPNGFLEKYSKGLIIDEIQLSPGLLSYIQVYSDKNNNNGRYIITGSQNFLLMQAISQSLAGRAALFNLLPFSISELSEARQLPTDSEECIFRGFYPRLYNNNLQPQEWLPSYIQLYVERDVRQIINLKDLGRFELFLKLCAGRIGQLINYTSFSTELGIDDKTVKSWISLLEASYIIFLLQPHHKNFNKRLVKTPKLYFCDTGLACSLLGINSNEQLQLHYLKGELFENMIIADLKKTIFNTWQNIGLYFWRNNTGNEIDVIIDKGISVKIAEIKSGKTIQSSFFKGLEYYRNLSSDHLLDSYLIYGGMENNKIKNSEVIPWNSTNKIIL